MKLKSILLLIAMLSSIYSVIANDYQKRGGVDLDALGKEKAEYLKKELQLTDDEAKSFLPLEAELMKKTYEMNREARREARALQDKENKTEADYKRITQLNLEADQKESALQIDYYKKFSQILSAEKIEKYRKADLKFKQELLKRRQKGD